MVEVIPRQSAHFGMKVFAQYVMAIAIAALLTLLFLRTSFDPASLIGDLFSLAPSALAAFDLGIPEGRNCGIAGCEYEDVSTAKRLISNYLIFLVLGTLLAGRVLSFRGSWPFTLVAVVIFAPVPYLWLKYGEYGGAGLSDELIAVPITLFVAPLFAIAGYHDRAIMSAFSSRKDRGQGRNT